VSLTQLVLFLILGAGFLFLLYLFAGRSSGRTERGAESLLEARDALHSLQSALLPPDLIVRTFARDDLNFVTSMRSPKIERVFLRERRRIALQWVAQVRKQVLNLKRFHSGESRRYAQLSARTEIALAFDFAALLIACRVLQVIFYLRGPYAASAIVNRAVGAAGKVCVVSEQSLAFLRPVSAGGLGGRSSGGRAAVS
jgi:hypothetical protein